MANNNFRNKLMALSPHIEMIVRRVYWANVKALRKRIKPKKPKGILDLLDYSKVSAFLNAAGVGSGSLLVIHSSYGSLRGRGKKPNEIIDFFLDLIDEKGTLAMPATPRFDNNPDVVEYLTSKNFKEKVFEYDVQKSKITTGVLPMMLHKRDGSIRSRFPINTMVSLGPLSADLFRDEFTSDFPLACGVGSSWQKLIANEALIIGFGTDLTHSLTSIHVAEDTYEHDWPIKDWYQEKKFKIVDGDFVDERLIRERLPKWGALHFGERTLCRDLIREGILRTTIIQGVLVEVLRAKELNDFLRAKQNSKVGYPYFWLRK
jgi:aminoglycoside 3-N-acetyltransferase